MSTDTRTRKQIRELERKRKQQLYILIGIVVVAIVGLGIVIVSTQRLTATTQAITGVAESGTYAGIEMSEDENGSPVIGSADAPLTIADYSSFSCGHCLGFHNDQFKKLLDYVRDGTVRFVYVPVAFDQYAASASVAAYCAGEQGKFWEMHDILFTLFSQYSVNGYTRARFDEAARALALDSQAFGACLVSPEASDAVAASTELLRQLAVDNPDVTGTPTVVFNGVVPDWGSGAPQWDYILNKINEAAG
jgi:protein-disulfide isomerase